MWRVVSILLLCMEFSIVVSAQNDHLELQLVTNSRIPIEPGVTTNLVIRMVNNKVDDETVNLNLDLPKGWRCFSELSDIEASGSQSTLKILSINIPSKTPMGDYSIIIEGYTKQGKKFGELKIPVIIVPKYALLIEFINGPEYVFAGDTLLVQFMLQNQSNTKVEIETLLKGTDIKEKSHLELKPDSNILITRKIIAEKGITKSLRRNISLSAVIIGKSEYMISNSHFYDVIPGSDVRFDPYNRFPVQLSTLFFTDNPRGRRDYGMLASASGQGFLDRKNTKLLKFHLQGPNRNGQPLYSIYDEYFMEYTTPKMNYLIGDRTYQLSFLTEYSRYGRGGRADINLNHFTFGTFVNFPRFFPKIKQESSVYVGYGLPGRLNINVGYLNKLNNTGDINHLMTFNGRASLLKGLKLDWEYSLGTVGQEYKQAYKTEVSLISKTINLTYSYLMAQKEYPGYFTDTRDMLVNAGIILSGRINIGVNYSYSHQNVALDTLYGSSPFSKRLYFILNYGFFNDGRISAGFHYNELQDQMIPMLFNYNEKSLRLNLYKRIGNLGIEFTGDYGKTENLLLPYNERLNLLYRARLTMNYRISAKFNVNGYATYDQSNRYRYKNYNSWVYGSSINGSVSKKLSLSLIYQSSYSVEEYNNNRSLFAGLLRYSINKNNTIELSSRYDLTKNSLNEKQFALTGRYIHNFNIPISKKRNIGKLSGSVINKGVKSVAGIILSIGSDQSITDKRGNYTFPMLPAGNYYLMIDYSMAGLSAVPEVPGPYQIEILPGRESRFDIGLTISGNITGEVTIQKEFSDQDKTYAGIRDRLGKLLVEANNGSEVFRIFTKENGEFSFENLRPGPWIVRVYQAGIPKEYELINDKINVPLASGQSEHIEVKIKEVRRRIKFQKSIDTNPEYETTRPPVPGSKKTDTSQKNMKPVRTAKSSVKTPEKITRMDTIQIKKQIKVVSVKGRESKSTSENLEYRIQLGSFDKPLVSTNALAARLSITEEIREDIFNGHYIYTIGSFKSQHEAALRNNEIQKRASTTASFIVSFRDGERIPNNEKPPFAQKLVLK